MSDINTTVFTTAISNCNDKAWEYLDELEDAITTANVEGIGIIGVKLQALATTCLVAEEYIDIFGGKYGPVEEVYADSIIYSEVGV